MTKGAIQASVVPKRHFSNEINDLQVKFLYYRKILASQWRFCFCVIMRRRIFTVVREWIRARDFSKKSLKPGS